MKIMKATPINDMFAKNGWIWRGRNRMVHDMYLFQVKKLRSESKGRLGRLQAACHRVLGEQAFQSLEAVALPAGEEVDVDPTSLRGAQRRSNPVFLCCSGLVPRFE